MAWVVNLKSLSSIVWVDRSLDYGTQYDPFSSTFWNDEIIMESMMPEGEPWEYYHHRSRLPNYNEDYLIELYHPSISDFFSNSIPINIIESERNLSNIKVMISIDI